MFQIRIGKPDGSRVADCVANPLTSAIYQITHKAYNDHPPPHFQVRYGEQRAIVAIESPTLLEGELSPRALGLIMEWAAAHRQELVEDWTLARQQQPLRRIAPLE